MQSFLITASDKKKTSQYISNFLEDMKIDPLDTDFQTFEKSLGIQDVRNIQKKISLKPFKGKTKSVIIDVYEGITLEAQNALLKILEEPPANTIIIIATAKKELILPTILSRCKIVSLYEKGIGLTQEDYSQLEKNLNTILDGKTGDRLKIAETISKNKEELHVWFKKMAILIRTKLMEDNCKCKYLDFLREFQKTYKAISSTNVNPRIILENFFLSF